MCPTCSLVPRPSCLGMRLHGMASSVTVDQLRQLSWEYVQRKDKEAWVGLFTEDSVVEDPVGVSPLDPTGKGHKGKAAISAFWDKVIANAPSIQIELISSRTCGNECACVMKVNGLLETITLYKMTANGKLASIRSFWDYEAMTAMAKH